MEGGVCRSFNSKIRFAYYEFYGIKTSLEAELLGLLSGLKHPADIIVEAVWIELDSLCLVQILNGKCSCPWQLHYYIQAIKDYLQQYEYRISHIYRKGNSMADGLANEAVD